MKLINAFIYALYLIVYAYSVWKTSVEPDKIIWGYLCVGIFTYLFIKTVKLFTKEKKNINESENSKENL